MATQNSINLSAAGVVSYDGAGTFSGSVLTQHDVLVGGAANAIVSVAPAATSGVPFISQGASSDPAFGTAVVAGGGTGAVSFTAHSLLLGQGTSALTALGAASNGQLAIGSSGADPVLATLSAGTGISISNGAGSITISATGSGLSWSVVTAATQSMAVDNGYISNAASGGVTYTLPATAAVGDILEVTGLSGGSGWVIDQNSGQSVQFGASSSTVGVGGSLASTGNTDSVRMVCAVANTTFVVLSSIGNITVV